MLKQLTIAALSGLALTACGIEVESTSPHKTAHDMHGEVYVESDEHAPRGGMHCPSGQYVKTKEWC